IGSERFGTRYRGYDPESRSFDHGEPLPIDLAQNARGYGLDVIEIAPGPKAVEELKAAVRTAKAATGPTLIHVSSDPLIGAPDGEGWWDVPVAEQSTHQPTQRARAEYQSERARQRPLLG
ncbi:MAG TPA: thiamine pyrophosphate-dependent enzyme, partial [Microlunatus sp.]|nr:thiamine pyrophosphate-dependent enzyme [Microlunatus sp.]